MALSTEQLALINNLTYTADIKPIPSIYDYEGMTVQDYISYTYPCHCTTNRFRFTASIPEGRFPASCRILPPLLRMNT